MPDMAHDDAGVGVEPSVGVSVGLGSEVGASVGPAGLVGSPVGGVVLGGGPVGGGVDVGSVLGFGAEGMVGVGFGVGFGAGFGAGGGGGGGAFHGVTLAENHSVCMPYPPRQISYPVSIAVRYHRELSRCLFSVYEKKFLRFRFTLSVCFCRQNRT
jgi:hypothetical protein